jgi:hypothetical protein
MATQIFFLIRILKQIYRKKAISENLKNGVKAQKIVCTVICLFALYIMRHVLKNPNQLI